MGAFKDIVNSILGEETEGYRDAVKQRQETGRLTTGGTGYSDKQTRALQFAQDVARGWSAQALGETMANGTPQTAQAVNAAKTAQSGVEGNSNYNALDSLDAAKRRSEGLLVDEENKKRADEYWNKMARYETLANGVSDAIQTYAGAKMKGYGKEVENGNTPFSTNTSN
jgi:hypothetical protein